MNKDEVYSWRLSSDLKYALEDAAKTQRTSIATLLDRVMTGWLRENVPSNGDAEIQRELHTAGMTCAGAIRGGDPHRGEQARDRVRRALQHKRAR